MELMKASNQWASRPDDERFTTLEALKESVSKRRRESHTIVTKASELKALPNNGDIAIRAHNRVTDQESFLQPSNWSFGQLSQAAKAPARYLRELPTELACINLQWGFENAGRDEHLLLARENGDHQLNALTSTTYGRIWDEEVVDSVIKVNQDGRWQVPSASYASKDPKRATTLYASDRDVFLFLVDPNNPIEVGDDTLFRGFMAWNSEVGRASFGLTTFLYRYVCDNRIVWGATDVKELRIRHTGGAPDRFAYEGAKYLSRYANESAGLIEGQVKQAKAKEIGKDKGDVTSWLKQRGFTATIADSAVAKAEEEEGGAGSLWNIIQGVTAHARSVEHTDTRVDLERKAGALMKYAS